MRTLHPTAGRELSEPAKPVIHENGAGEHVSYTLCTLQVSMVRNAGHWLMRVGKQGVLHFVGCDCAHTRSNNHL